MNESSKEINEETKRVLAIADKIDPFSMMNTIIALLRAFGNFAKVLGDIQLRSPEAYELIIEFGKSAPEILKKSLKRVLQLL